MLDNLYMLASTPVSGYLSGIYDAISASASRLDKTYPPAKFHGRLTIHLNFQDFMMVLVQVNTVNPRHNPIQVGGGDRLARRVFSSI
jgi:hypothetical protein